MEKFKIILFLKTTSIVLILVGFLFTYPLYIFATPPSSPIKIQSIYLEKSSFKTNEEIKVNLRISCICEGYIDNVGIYTFFDKDPYRDINFYQENPIKHISLNSGENNQVELILPQQKEGKHSLQVSVIKLAGDSEYAGDTEQLSLEVVGQRNALTNLLLNIKNFFLKLFREPK